MIVLYIVILYLFCSFLFARIFMMLLTPDYPKTAKQYGKIYNMKTVIGNRSIDIKEPYYFDSDRAAYPYLRSFFWPIMLIIYFFEFVIFRAMKRSIKKRAQAVLDKENEKKFIEKYIAGEVDIDV